MSTDLKIYYFPTPNGRKITIALEEMGLLYDTIQIDILNGGQKAPAFLELSPNGRIPALTDVEADGTPLKIFQSGAMLQYLGRKSGKFYPLNEAARVWIDAWIFWQVAGLAPMTGQLNWFLRVSETPDRDPKDSSYAIHRYTKETKRLYAVLEQQLTGRDYICDDYSLADMASWPWVHQYGYRVGLENYPNTAAWFDRVNARPAVQRALAVGTEWIAHLMPAAQAPS